MHKVSVDLLREEAKRLIDVELGLFEKIKERQGVIVDAEPGAEQTLSEKKLIKFSEFLDGEKRKLENLELVVAVVGTMKAGKSTTINAIVGKEVLPSRNAPMTTLPTLIRHVQGQQSPVLKFKNSAPIVALMDAIRKKQVADDGASEFSDILKFIESGKKVEESYSGEIEIFNFLKMLNDLVRLSRDVDVEFPFSDYDEIHELPVIEVEFTHLSESSSELGRLTLLDTPGPNESGHQVELKKMMKDQLQKASAVIVVLDYCQLQSDADAEVRNQVIEISSINRGNVYAFVNKFDQKDRNGDSFDAVKKRVEGLMQENVSLDNIFPVSSMLAGLSGRAQAELNHHGKMPSSDSAHWVEDFADKVFGPLWESEDLVDLDRLKKGIDALWKKSNFNEPLDKTIKKAHANAAIGSVQSAAGKLLGYAKLTKNFLTAREQALTSSAKTLKSQIDSLKDDIQRVARAEKSTREESEKILEDFEKKVSEVFGEANKSVSTTLKRYFKEGKTLEGKRVARKKKEAEEKKSKSILGLWFQQVNVKVTEGVDFDPTSQIIRFEEYERDEARKLEGKIEHSLDVISKNAEKGIRKGLDAVTEGFKDHFVENVKGEAETLLKEMKAHLEEGGFDLDLEIPETGKLRLGFSASEMLDDIVSKKVDTKTFSRAKGVGFVNWITRGHFGREDYDEDITTYVINIKDVEKKALSSMKKTFSELGKSIGIYVKKPLEESVDRFFADFKGLVEEIRCDLAQGLLDHRKTEDEKKSLAKDLGDLNRQVCGIKEDAGGLVKDCREDKDEPRT